MATDTMQEQVIINSQVVTPQTLLTWRQGKTGIEADLADFLEEWFYGLQNFR